MEKTGLRCTHFNHFNCGTQSLYAALSKVSMRLDVSSHFTRTRKTEAAPASEMYNVKKYVDVLSPKKDGTFTK